METNEKGCVYFFRHIGLTPVKIGYSSHESPLGRFEQFKTYAPYGSEIIGFIQTADAKELETRLHQKFANKRINGEWFEITEYEAIYEIDFYSKIEDVAERNKFQQLWAQHLKDKSDNKIKVLDDSKDKKRDLYFKIYYGNKNLSISEKANLVGVSRKTIYIWNKDIEGCNIDGYNKS